MTLVYYNFSSVCINSEYVGVSIPSNTFSPSSPLTVGLTYNFQSITNCVENCGGLPTELSGCFTLIGGPTLSLLYPLYTTIGSFVTTPVNECECPTEQEYIYFQYCCEQQGDDKNNYFGILTDPGIFQQGQVYFIGVGSISACTTVVSSIGLPEGVSIYQNIPYTYESYNTCRACTATTVGCAVTPTPTPTIFFSSDTRCGDNILKRNECDPIVIFPLGVSCIGANPTITTESNGELSLVITGGTPPYTVFWSNGSNGLFITNLSVGSYSAVVTDYYGDFTAYTTCTLTAPTPEPTPTPTPTPTPEGDPFCLTITSASNFGTSPPLTTQLYFYPLNETVNGRTKYVDNNSHEVEWTLNPPPAYWNLINSPNNGTITSTSVDDPPISGWTVAGDAQGTISANLGDCPVYSNLCFSFYQTKQEQISTDQVTMVYDGTVNGQPSWQSVVINNGVPVELYRYIIYWNPNLSRWEVQILDPTNYGTQYPIINTNPASPPITNWQQPGSYSPSDYVSVTLGNCTEISAITYPECLSVYILQGPPLINISEQLLLSGTINGQPSWVTSNGLSSISWNTSGYWEYTTVDGILNNEVRNTNIDAPPLAGWTTIGCVTICTVQVEVCDTVAGRQLLENNAETNQPTVRNAMTNTSYDGNIVLKASKGVGPYQYSIDGGLTYRSIPIFTKLSPGTYPTVIKDSLGNKVFNTVILNSPPKPIMYEVSLETNSTKQRNNSTLYTSTVKITPDLPSGTTLTFDLIHTNVFRTSTGETSATLINSSFVKKNNINYTANTINTVSSTTLSTIAGCQLKTVYTTTKTETWSSLQYINSTNLSVQSNTLITKNITDKCYIGESADTFVISNLRISGCTNCGVVNGSV